MPVVFMMKLRLRTILWAVALMMAATILLALALGALTDVLIALAIVSVSRGRRAREA